MTLQEKIEKVFAHRQLPAEVVNMEGRFQIDSDIEDGLWFKGRDWHELTHEDWHRRHWGFYFLSPDAFAYYLPSLLTLTILNPRDIPVWRSIRSFRNWIGVPARRTSTSL